MTTTNFIFLLAVFTLLCAAGIGVWQLVRTRKAKKTGEPAVHRARKDPRQR